MPNPWEPSSFQLKSTLSFAAASLMPPTRLNDVMLLPPRSNWQARLHDKFEEFAQGFDQDGERWERPAKHPFLAAQRQRGAAKLSNRTELQFLRSSDLPRTWTRVGSKIHQFGKCSLTLRKGQPGIASKTRTPVLLTIFRSRSPVGLAATQASG